MYTRKAQEYGGSAGGTTAYAQIQERMNARDYPGTIKLCDQLLASEPKHANAWLTKARAADQTGQQAVAIDAYTKYLELRPDNVSETAAMIIVMAESGQCDRAVTAARTAGQKFAGLGHKALGKIDFAHGKALFCAKDYAGSKRQFEKAARSGDPNWVGPAREGISACDQYINYEAQQLKQGN